jgi:hypothetical protein
MTPAVRKKILRERKLVRTFVLPPWALRYQPAAEMIYGQYVTVDVV